MSKITSKNLHYDDSLPPFLARLRANNNAGDGRHEYTVARPKKVRTAEDEAEDEPVYFNEESGETLTKGEWEAREAGLEKGEGDGGEQAEGGEGSIGKTGETKESKESKEKVAAIGASKKRKAGKVVGGEDEDQVPVAKVPTDTKAPSQAGKKSEKGEKGKSTKKVKKVKLSFGDDE